MSRSLSVGSLMLALVLASPVMAEDAASSSSQAVQPQPVTLTYPSAAFDNAVQDVLQRHPEMVNDALAAFQAKQEAKKQDAAKAAIATESAKIFDDPNSPVAGNPNGSETVVEFFDYSCHYCKQIHPDLQTLIKDDPNVKIIYKDFPILGPGSLLAAKAALAAKMQGKYMPMHDAMLDFKGQFDDAAIEQIAQGAGVDYGKLKTDMDKPEIMQTLTANVQLADTLNIHGTPSLIINKKPVYGALPLDELKKKLKEG